MKVKINNFNNVYKNAKEKIKKEEKGLTLIALGVTIIVLLILAGVAISLSIGENGIFKRAQNVTDIWKNAERNEQLVMEGAANFIDGLGENNPVKPEGPEMPDGWDKDKVDVIDDGKGKPVPLPKGFYHLGGNIDTGIVISDKEGDTLESSGVNMGNQFVWIPVASEADLERTEFNTSTGKPTTGLDTTAYTEPYANGYPTEKAEYDTMKTQVLKYGGFYIGRFEAGVDSTTPRTGVTPAQKVVVKKGVAPYNYVPWGKAMNDASEIEGKSGAVYLAKNFAVQEKYASVTSTLCYGSQWDAMCRYIEDSNRTTPTKAEPELTGAVETDVSKNIYDLAGNCYEWTMESYSSTSRALRGGVYYNGDAVSHRGYRNPIDGIVNFVFRPTLYIK